MDKTTKCPCCGSFVPKSDKQIREGELVNFIEKALLTRGDIDGISHDDNEVVLTLTSGYQFSITIEHTNYEGD